MRHKVPHFTSKPPVCRRIVSRLSSYDFPIPGWYVQLRERKYITSLSDHGIAGKIVPNAGSYIFTDPK
jgi:hypothetical protein